MTGRTTITITTDDDSVQAVVFQPDEGGSWSAAIVVGDENVAFKGGAVEVSHRRHLLVGWGSTPSEAGLNAFSKASPFQTDKAADGAATVRSMFESWPGGHPPKEIPC
jgi:hypothetical protein